MKLDEILPHISRQIKAQQWTCAVLAVSGGLDSIGLADYFIQNKSTLGLEHLAIAHVHHGLRKETADLDANFVRHFAEERNVPYFQKKLDGAALKNQKGSLEENARKARYDALLSFAKEMPGKVAIITAHHGNDQAETLYYRIRRGVSLAGLQGIQSVRSLDSVDLFRPFLQVTRKDLQEYALQRNLNWREDESNSDEKFARNEIRHSQLPYLEKTVPGAVQQLCHVAELSQKIYRKVILIAERCYAAALISQSHWPFKKEFSPYRNVLALDLKKLPFKSLPEVLQNEVFRLWLDSRGYRIPVGEKILANAGQRFIRLKGIFIEKCRDILWICDLRHNMEQNNLYLVREQNFSEEAEGLRFRKTGDILWPTDEKIPPRKLEQWLREKNIPCWMHDSLPLRASGERVLFVYGLLLQEK